MHAVHVWILAGMLLAVFQVCGLGADGGYHVYIGTYTSGKSDGVYRADFDAKTGTLGDATLVAKSENPSFLAVHGKQLFAVNELTKYQGANAGAVSAFQIDPATGSLKLINQQSSGGGAPCHLVVDATGRHVLVANYVGGNVAANYVGGNVASLPIRSDGSLGPITTLIQHKGSSVNKRRQEKPHAHSINLDANNRFAFAADLGADRIFAYAFQPDSGKLVAHNPATELKPGSGPRHFVFHPSGEFAYVINEMALTVTAYRYDAKAGRLSELQTISTLPESVTDHRGLSTAEVRITPDGKYLYGSNRGHDTIAMFAIDQESGKLTHLGNQPTGGRTPRNFNVGPEGKFLFAANQSTHNVVVFRIDPETGNLEGTGRAIYVPNPVCIRFLKKP